MTALFLHRWTSTPGGVKPTVPIAASRELLRNSGLLESALIVVGTEHRLADEVSLAKMAEVVERAVKPG